MLINLEIPFKHISLVSDGDLNIRITTKAMNEVIQRLVATGHLTVEEMAIHIIGQLKRCDSKNLDNVLPECVWKKLVSTYGSVKNGE